MFHKVFEYFEITTLSHFLCICLKCAVLWGFGVDLFFLFSFEFRVRMLHVIGKLLLNTPINGSEICG